MKKLRTHEQVVNSISKHLEFDAPSMQARWESDQLYVVYSYGTHWPLAAVVVDHGAMIRKLFNTETHSVTTSKHFSLVARALGGWGPGSTTSFHDCDSLKRAIRDNDLDPPTPLERQGYVIDKTYKVGCPKARLMQGSIVKLVAQNIHDHSEGTVEIIVGDYNPRFKSQGPQCSLPLKCLEEITDEDV